MSDWDWLKDFIEYYYLDDKCNLTSEKEHGKCVEYKHSIYHDIYIYEDGYEEWVDIGD